MEGSGPRVELKSRYHCGGSVLRGGNESSSFCYSVHYGTSGSSQDLDTTQQRHLADVLLQYSDLFPVPG